MDLSETIQSSLSYDGECAVAAAFLESSEQSFPTLTSESEEMKTPKMDKNTKTYQKIEQNFQKEIEGERNGIQWEAMSCNAMQLMSVM